MVINIFILFTSSGVCCQCWGHTAAMRWVVFRFLLQQRAEERVDCRYESVVMLLGVREKCSSFHDLIISNSISFKWSITKARESKPPLYEWERDALLRWNFQMKFRGKIGREASKISAKRVKESFSPLSSLYVGRSSTVRNKFTGVETDDNSTMNPFKWNINFVAQFSVSELVILMDFFQFLDFQWNGKKLRLSERLSIYNWNSQELPFTYTEFNKTKNAQ